MGVQVPESTLVFTLGISRQKADGSQAVWIKSGFIPRIFWGEKSYDATGILASGAELT